MLDYFLENTTKKKLYLFSILYLKRVTSVKECKYILTFSSTSIISIINELNFDFNGIAEINITNSLELKLIVYEDITFSDLLHGSSTNPQWISLCGHLEAVIGNYLLSQAGNPEAYWYAIYQSSNVLHCIKFMITNESNHSFLVFAEDNYLAKSSAYRIRQKCIKYIRSIGLDIKKNKVIGEEYRIRFLIALLYYKCGIDCCDIDEYSIKLIKEFIISTNQSITFEFLNNATNEYDYFECLMSLLWKRKDHNNNLSIPKELEKFKEIFIYNDLKKYLHNVIGNQLNIDFSKKDYDYMYLVYFCTNNFLFANQWTEERKEHIYKIFLSNQKFYDLYIRLSHKYGKFLEQSHIFKTILIYFFKDHLFQLQCLIPNQRLYIDTTPTTTYITNNDVSGIINSWKKANNILYPTDKRSIFYLTTQIEFILRQLVPPVTIILLSDLMSEIEMINLFLEKNFSRNRINITPLLLNSYNLEYLNAEKNRIIIITRGIEYLLKSYNFFQNNTIVIIDSRTTLYEKEKISNAIANYEEKQFLKICAGTSLTDTEY